METSQIRVALRPPIKQHLIRSTTTSSKRCKTYENSSVTVGQESVALQTPIVDNSRIGLNRWEALVQVWARLVDWRLV